MVCRLLLLAAAVVCSSPVILPTGTHMYLAYDTIIMESSSSRRFHCFLPPIYTNTNPLHTRSTSYLQCFDLIENHTVPLGSQLSFLRSLSASFATCLTGMRGEGSLVYTKKGLDQNIFAGSVRYFDLTSRLGSGLEWCGSR